MLDEIIDQLVAKRRGQRISLLSLSEKIGTNPATLNRWENKRVYPTSQSLEKWVSSLGLELSLKILP